MDFLHPEFQWIDSDGFSDCSNDLELQQVEFARFLGKFKQAIMCARKYDWSEAKCVARFQEIEAQLDHEGVAADHQAKAALDILVPILKAERLALQSQVRGLHKVIKVMGKEYLTAASLEAIQTWVTKSAVKLADIKAPKAPEELEVMKAHSGVADVHAPPPSLNSIPPEQTPEAEALKRELAKAERLKVEAEQAHAGSERFQTENAARKAQPSKGEAVDSKAPGNELPVAAVVADGEWFTQEDNKMNPSETGADSEWFTKKKSNKNQSFVGEISNSQDDALVASIHLGETHDIERHSSDP